ncbi:MAG: hypothetical protein CL780_02975 [Chloroflexi bacterium]|nr:hypothetical protein [Chloroflexota bacterium]|tara:strand:+ start:1996 stop:2790 length:795 start_codon:yes stop_codon:yes gene_type:complete
MSYKDVNLYKKIGLEATDHASKILMRNFSNFSQINKWEKSENALVTDADIESDKCIKQKLLEIDSSILSEESTHKAISSNLTWLVDPLCGTVPFSLGLPHWGINIALHDRQELLLGIVSVPLSNEILVGIKQEGVQRNGILFKPNKGIKDLSKSTIVLEIDGGNEWRKLLKSKLNWISYVGQVNTFSSVAYPMSHLCQGRLGGGVFYGIDSVHLAAGALIAQELGMCVSDEENNIIDWKNNHEKPIVIIGWPQIHKEILERINR